MSITNYTDLQVAVADRMNRTDLGTVIPESIAAAEAEFNRVLRMPQQVVINTAFACASTRTALPSDFLSMERVRLPTSSTTTFSGYSIYGTYIEIAPDPSLYGTVTLEIFYYGKIPPLASNSTNFLLTLNPDLYLYRSCMECAERMQDQERMQMYSSLYSNVLPAVENAGDYYQYGAGLTVRAG